MKNLNRSIIAADAVKEVIVKKTSITAVAVMVVVLMVCNGCQNPLNTKPVPPKPPVTNPDPDNPDNPYYTGGSTNRIMGLSATHGNRRTITLSWDEFPGATRYYIYSTNSLLANFEKFAETTATQYIVDVAPGSTFYYRVSVLAGKQESPQSSYVMGSSLARPVISDITGVTESSATVTWYMENVSNETYKADLGYTVYCFDDGSEFAQVEMDGSQENKVSFDNLEQGKKYEYQVTAYLKSDPSINEESEKLDRDTARRLRPGEPENIRASKGTAANSIKLSFELPEMVNIAPTANGEEMHGLYFVISRKLTTESSFKKVCTYFGAADEASPNAAKTSAAPTFPSYEPGETVTWTDTNTRTNQIIRGMDYEYHVQAYVDGTPRILTSDTSIATAIGWTVNEANLSIGEPVYTLSANGFENAGATLPLTFTLDAKGQEYRYQIVETITPLGDDHPYNPGEKIVRESEFLSYEQISHYTASMDLTKKTTAASPGRGKYEYKVKISLPEGAVIDTVTATGYKNIWENLIQVTIELSVQDGFTDKFHITWNFQTGIQYILLESSDKTTWDEKEGYKDLTSGSVDVTGYRPGQTVYFGMKAVIAGIEVGQIFLTTGFHTLGVMGEFSVQDGYADKFHISWNSEPGIQYTLLESTDKATPHSEWDPKAGYENMTSGSVVVGGYEPGLIRYFGMRAVKDGKEAGEKFLDTGFQTLGVPELQPARPSYGAVEIKWKEAQKADTYRIKYRIGEGNYETVTVRKDDLSLNDGHYTYSVSVFAGNTIDVAKAGQLGEIKMSVDALNKALQMAVGGGEIATSSTEHTTHLVGPALLNPRASHAAFPMDIEVSWEEISGATGYYVFRRQFNMDNTAEEGDRTIEYYVPATKTSITVTGKDLAQDSEGFLINTTTVKATASFSDTRYTLKDSYLTDSEYNDSSYNRHIPAYRNQQNDMAQGYSYRYFVVPVINRDEGIAVVFDEDKIVSYSITENDVEITYTGVAALEKDGFTIGFGQDVTATKGTYKSSGNVNNGIRITWNTPVRLASVAGFSPRYTVYRRDSTSSTWGTPVASSIEAKEYVDLVPTPGIAYEYVVGIANGASETRTDPRSSQRFIELCKIDKDEQDRPNYLGFVLDKVKMISVSRDARKDESGNFGELVQWQSAGIRTAVSEDSNWGIDGYTIYLLNRNINNLRQWIEVADIPADGLPNHAGQSFFVANNADNILKVLRDYRHYFKVRSFVLDDLGEKVYCPDPSPVTTWTTGGATSSYVWANGAEDDYVKWGARQVTPEEYAAITSLHMAIALQWYSSSEPPPDRQWQGRPHNITESRKNVSYDVDLKFNNSQPYFLTIAGTLYAFAGASWEIPCEYAAYCNGSFGVLNQGKNMRSTFNITGPADLNGMYSGTVDITERITHADVGPRGSYGGKYNVSYNGLSGAPEWKHFGNSFRYYSGVSNSTSMDYKQTRNLDWSLGTGITATNNISGQTDKWWYPLDNARVGWD